MLKRTVSEKVVVRWIAAFLALAVIASACGSRDDDPAATETADPAPVASEDTPSDPPEDTPDGTEPGVTTPEVTEPPEADVCDVELEATEIGVTADTIKVIVMADSDNPLAPGLFDGARDGALAWAANLNERGGIACRTVEIEFWDSQLNQTATTNGFLRACSEALALVGTTVLFGTDTTDLTTCPDQAGNPTGVPDLAYITTEVPHQCSSVSFHLSRPGVECPYEGGERDAVAAVGAVQYLLEQNGGDLRGLFLVPGDLPSTTVSAIPQIAGHEAIGVVYDKAYGISGLDPQSAFTPYVATMRENDLNFVYNGSNDAAMSNLLSEAADQGFDVDSVTWLCSLACYTPSYLENGDKVEGTYVWLFFLPFEETDTNAELAAFMDAIDTDFPAAWAAGAWGDGILFEQVVNQIVEADGPNALTRARLLDELRATDSFDVNGWWGSADFTSTLTTADCFVLLQVQNNEFVRVFPAERGTLDCETEPIPVTVNPDTFTPDS